MFIVTVMIFWLAFFLKVMSNMTFIDKSNDHCNSFQISMSLNLHDVMQMPYIWTLLDPLLVPAIVDSQEMGFLVSESRFYTLLRLWYLYNKKSLDDARVH